jgi:hypothetical protein
MFPCRPRLKHDGTCGETRFGLSLKRTSPFKSAGASVQSTAGSRGVRISGSNAGYTTFQGSVRVLATHSNRQFPLHFPSRASPCAIRIQMHSSYTVIREHINLCLLESQFFTVCWPCIMLWFLVNDQRNAQFFTIYLFLFFLTLHMFRTHRAHRQERQTVSKQPLVTVTLCWRPYRMQVRSELPTCTRYGHRHRVTVTRGCFDTVCLSWRWAQCDRNMQS